MAQETNIKQLIPQSLPTSLTKSESKEEAKEIAKYELEGEELMVANAHKLNFPIRKFDAGNKAELIKRLAAISESIGIKVLNKEPLKFIVEILQDQYSDFTLQDLDTAFKFAFAGKLNAVDKKLVTHFQSFDATYVCPILNAYRDYRNKILAKEKQFNHQKELAEETRVNRFDPEVWKASFERLVGFIQKEKKLPIGWDWEICFWHCEKAGLIKDTNEEKLIFMDNVKEDLKEEISDFTRLKERLKKENLIGECRKRRVQQFLRSNYEIL